MLHASGNGRHRWMQKEEVAKTPAHGVEGIEGNGIFTNCPKL